MQLERLKIQNFRNLRDFEITFIGKATDADGSERPFKSHAVIGQNGTGKSNMIEAIVTIFRDLDHQPLHELPGVADNDPASLARWIRDRTLPLLPQLDRIDLYETRGSGAILSWGEEGPALPV